VAFGLQDGGAPDHFSVALAVLSPLAGAAEARRPLVCRIDDAPWLDRTSGQALAFVARRWQAERIVIPKRVTAASAQARAATAAGVGE
jgi:hypothetical protein